MDKLKVVEYVIVLANLLSFQHPDVKVFHFFSGPGCFPQKFEAGLHARIMLKTVDVYMIAHLFPAVVINQFIKDRFQGFSVKGVVGLNFHDRMLNVTASLK
jgi:hypothetical protein